MFSMRKAEYNLMKLLKTKQNYKLNCGHRDPLNSFFSDSCIHFTVCVRDRDVHKQWYQTEFFFSFSFTLSEPLMLRIHQKFKAQALAGARNTLAGMHSHTHMLIR
jgi:hypothetical protein